MCIATIMDLSDSRAIEGIFSQLEQLEDGWFVTFFHLQVQKEREKTWHDRHIKHKKLQVGDLVLLYYSNFMQHPRKF
jgi:hypothetical protein